MANKKHIQKDVIVKNALALIKEQGIEKLNARSLANKLGCSTQPLFYSFKNMEEIESGALLLGEEELEKAIFPRGNSKASIEDMCFRLTNFYNEQFNLFSFIFASKNSLYFSSFINKIAFLSSTTLLEKKMNPKDANLLCLNLLIYTFGLISFMKEKALQFDEEKFKKLIGAELKRLSQ